MAVRLSMRLRWRYENVRGQLEYESIALCARTDAMLMSMWSVDHLDTDTSTGDPAPHLDRIFSSLSNPNGF